LTISASTVKSTLLPALKLSEAAPLGVVRRPGIYPIAATRFLGVPIWIPGQSPDRPRLFLIPFFPAGFMSALVHTKETEIDAD